MSSYSLNTTLNSYVNEHAYLPLSSPVRACVCSAGSRGLSASLLSSSVYGPLSCGFFFAIFLAFFRYVGEYSSLCFIKNSLYSILYRLKADRRFFFGLQHLLNQFFAPALSIGKIGSKVSDLSSSRFRKLGKDIFYMFYFVNCSVHRCIIAQVRRKAG